ncbi:MAG: tryptophan--tRNA ligase [Puniceicoccales bacterium]|jgi:tryptophanyl-tRNA synthetase|nr:tryptophan--tRNA ligase [Puniceicoccales bacterium]
MDPMPVLVTGLQPTAEIHLGNYLGAIRSWTVLQRRTESFFFLADLHALTTAPEPEKLRAHTLDCAAMLLACGIDPNFAHIFVQSQVHGHTDLAWFLSCWTSLGQLERMTQFKDKAARREDGFVGAGLLYYPVLMAADILLYGANLVPVGEDQRQHLELTRDLAIRFNGAHPDTFPVPEPFYPENCARVMSLQNPTAKMSKSDPNRAGVLFLSDDDGTIRKKIRSAVTDSGRELRSGPDKPGISNLLQILAALTEEPVAQLERRYGDSSYGEFKGAVAEAAVAAIGPIREKYFALKCQRDYLLDVLAEGRRATQARADVTLAAVRDRLGLL